MAKDEDILFTTRQHWLMLFERILFDFFILSTITAGCIFFFPAVGYWVIIPGLIVFLPLVDMLRHILDWTNRLFIITNRRVIHISGTFNQTMCDSSLEMVNDVKLSQSLLGRFFDYGDIEILTANEIGNNKFQAIGNPVSFKKKMMDVRNHMPDKSTSGLIFRNVVKETTIPDLIEELDALRIKGIITGEEFQEKKKELLSRL